jgi:glutamate N-acetyltransferase/amino-acid N-acetyltransferase
MVDTSGPPRLIEGGVTAAEGFVATGLACGIKKGGGADLALLHCPGGAAAAGLFTRNDVVAAPVTLGRERLPARGVHGVVINSGCANACTGEPGLAAAREVVAAAARVLGCLPAAVLPCSTGVIGDPLPAAKISAALPRANALLARDGGHAFATAILTTDTVAKEAAVEVALSGGTVRIGGCAKGAGMIHPNMATMLAVITTDVILTAEQAHALLTAAAAATFNRISIDGDTSTNDTLYLLASGATGVTLASPVDRERFAAALKTVCGRLAQAIVRDGEGATKLATVHVVGGRSAEQVAKVGTAIVRSPLVKTALFGGDANWGRIVCAAGYAGAGITPETVSLRLGDLVLFEAGVPTGAGRSQAAADLMAAADIEITLDLGQGHAATTFWTCDLSYDYVRINAEYRT